MRYWDGQQWTPYTDPAVIVSSAAAGPQDTTAEWSPLIAASTPSRTGYLPRPLQGLGWGGLVATLALGLASSGVSGGLTLVGLFGLVVAMVVLIRGSVGWARLHGRRAGIATMAVALLAMFTGGAIAAPPSPGSGTAVAPTSASTTTSTTMAGPVETTAPPTTTATTATTAPAGTGVGTVVVMASGVVLPNPHRTPGALNPRVTQASIQQTICVAGWADTVRPATNVTQAIKSAQLASGYGYHGDVNAGDYQEDHLIPLELGGAPASAANLWPQPSQTPTSAQGAGVLVGATSKDRLEDQLHTLVCAGQLTLASAQKAIASNWWTAYQRYATITPTAKPAPRPLASIPPKAPARTTPPALAPAPAPPPPAPPVLPGGGATAQCNDGTYSYAAHHQGACSHHGGVRVFYK